MIAGALNLSRAEVHGVVTFYHDFRAEPAGRHVLKLCRAEACQSMGCEALVAAPKRRSASRCGSTTRRRRVTLEAVYCLGLCATAPSAMLDGRPVGRLDRDAARRARRGGARDDRRIFVPARRRRRRRAAPTRSRWRSRRPRSRGSAVEIVRNGSRGLFWLEPLVEVETPAGRIGFGPVDARRTPRPCSRRWPRDGGAHPTAASAPPRSCPSSRARPA